MQLLGQLLIRDACLLALLEIDIADVTRFSLDFFQVSFRQFYLFFVFRQKSLCRIFTKTPFDHFFNLQSFHAEQIQDHVVRQPKLRP